MVKFSKIINKEDVATSYEYNTASPAFSSNILQNILVLVCKLELRMKISE